MLQKWNQVMNLVGPDSLIEIVNTLVLDSFHLAGFLSQIQLPASPLCWDFGSGAGIPGIPLRILWQKGNYYMVEIREKRVLFMRTALAKINLPRTHVLQARIENFLEKSEPADLLVSRAFMPWEKLLGLMRGRLAPGGMILIMAREPARKLPTALAERWNLVDEHSYRLPGKKTHYFRLLSSL